MKYQIVVAKRLDLARFLLLIFLWGAMGTLLWVEFCFFFFLYLCLYLRDCALAYSEREKKAPRSSGSVHVLRLCCTVQSSQDMYIYLREHSASYPS